MKKMISSILLVTIFIVTNLNAQTHTVIMPGGDKIIVGAPKSEYSFDQKNSTNYTPAKKEDKQYKTPASNTSGSSGPALNLRIKVTSTDGKIGFKNENGYMVSSYYDAGEWMLENMYFPEFGYGKVKNDNKWGLLNFRGSVAIPLEYDEISDRKVGYWQLKKGDDIYFASQRIYDYDSYYIVTSTDMNNPAFVLFDSKIYFLDENGKTTRILSENYEAAEPFHNGIAKVQRNGKLGFIDKTGKEKVIAKYDNIKDLIFGKLMLIDANGKFGMIDSKGNELTEVKYDNIEENSYSSSIFKVKLNNKYGFIDTMGKEVTPLKYDEIGTIFSYSRGLTVVKFNGKYGYIDITGKEVIPIKYDFANSFDYSVTSVELNKKWALINMKGIEVTPFKYDNLGSFYYRTASAKINGKIGSIDTTGNEVIPIIYDNLDYIYDKDYSTNAKCATLAHSNGKCGILSDKGKVIIPVIYDSLKYVYDKKNKRSIEAVLNGQHLILNEKGNVLEKIQNNH